MDDEQFERFKAFMTRQQAEFEVNYAQAHKLNARIDKRIKRTDKILARVSKKIARLDRNILKLNVQLPLISKPNKYKTNTDHLTQQNTEIDIKLRRLKALINELEKPKN